MSGHKRALVRLNRQEVNRIESLDSKLRQAEQDYQDIRQSLHQERKRYMQEFNQAVDSRQKVFQDVLSDYNHEVIALEKKTGDALRVQAELFTQRMEDQKIEIWNQTDTYFKHHFNNVNTLVEQNNHEIIGYFDELNQELSSIYSQQDSQYLIAEQGIQTAAGLFQSIHEVYDHNRFFPGLLDQVKDEIDSSINNLNRGLAEAALVQSQGACQQLSNLRFQLEEIIQQNSLGKSVLLEKIHHLSMLLDKNEFVSAVNINGEELEVTLDVDFWTSGGYSRLKNRCNGLVNQLIAEDLDLQAEDYERILKFILPQIENSMHDLISDARLKVILSQIRYNIADTVLGKLEEQGFEVQSANYEERDERHPYELIVKNLEGSQVKVFIESGDSPGNYCLEIQTKEPDLYTDAELRSRANMILNSLRSAGLQVGSPLEIKNSKRESESRYQQPSYHEAGIRLSGAYGD